MGPSPRQGSHEVLRYKHDLDPPVQGFPSSVSFGAIVRYSEYPHAERTCGFIPPSLVDTALRWSPGRSKAPNSWELVDDLRADRNIVCVAFNPDPFVGRLFQDSGDPVQDLFPVGLISARPGVKEVPLDHAERQLVFKLRDRGSLRP